MATFALPLLWMGLRLVGVAFNAGLMWTVAAVSYPLFSHVSANAFSAYHAAHCRRMQWLVGPSFALEGVSVLGCFFYGAGALNLLSGILFAVGILVTGLVAVPLHARLEKGPSASTLARLRNVHLARCFIWSLHCGVAGAAWGVSAGVISWAQAL